MTDYEIWGPNDDGENVMLGTRSGPVPKEGDTIDVDGKQRDVKNVNQHHSDDSVTTKVHVGQYDNGAPLPMII